MDQLRGNLQQQQHDHNFAARHQDSLYAFHTPHQSGNKKMITMIGGFFGSGKTTLANHILSQFPDKKIDVIVREYGTVSIDDRLLHLDKSRIHVFPGASAHVDSQSMLYSFLDRLYEESTFDFLLLETSGMDAAEYLVQLFFLGNITYRYQLGSYITMIDAQYGHLNLDEFEVAGEQIAYADVVVINKIDLVDQAAVQSLERRIKGINSLAKIVYACYGETDLAGVLNIDSYNQLTSLPKNAKKGAEEFNIDGITTTVLTENHPMRKDLLDKWLQKLFVEHGDKILRSKGFFYIAGSGYRHEFQAVRKTFHAQTDSVWNDDEERKSVVVLIGKELPDEKELQDSFRRCKDDSIHVYLR